MGAINPGSGHQRTPASLLRIPAELRNQIYNHLFTPPVYEAPKIDGNVQLPSLADFGRPTLYTHHPPGTDQYAAVVYASRQLCQETQLLYLGSTLFHLVGATADPTTFANRIAHMAPQCKRAIRHIALTARISHLRALNESWNSLPFGQSDIVLDTLTLIPNRPMTYSQAYGEVADLSQCHTLAYILAETLKGLRNVDTVVVRNEGCFNNVIWRLSYRSLIYRLWKWSGRLCDLRFKEDENEAVFYVRGARSGCGLDETSASRKNDEEGWMDVVQELNRVLGPQGNREGMAEQTM